MSDSSLLFDTQGRRKYLTLEERKAFYWAAGRRSLLDQTFAHLLLYSGCRISEAQSLRPWHIDVDGRAVAIRTLKRRTVHVRVVPVPSQVWQITSLTLGPERMKQDRLIWPWCRTTGWRRVKAMMALAGIAGPHATPRGLRHSFAVEAVSKGVPLTVLKKWMGHARLQSTEVYTQLVGPEERVFAERLWVP